LLSSAAQLGQAKIAHAQLISFIFSKMNEAGFIFCGATWASQDCARPANLIHFFKNE
jgi:hypothetical protein